MKLRFGGTTIIETNSQAVRLKTREILDLYRQNLGEPPVDVFSQTTTKNPYSIAVVTKNADFESWFRQMFHDQTVVWRSRNGWRTRVVRENTCLAFPDTSRLSLDNYLGWC